MGKKLIMSLSLFMALLMLFSCREGTTAHMYEDIKNDFAQYEGSNDAALVLYNSRLYFYDHTLDLETLFPADEDFTFQYATMMNDMVYFVVSLKEETKAIFTTILYQCDFYGNDLKMLYKKENLDHVTFVDFYSGIFYFKHSESQMQTIETYNCLDGTLKNLGSFKDVDLDEYVKPLELYKWEKIEDQHFVITQKETGKQRIIDESTFKNSEFYPLLEKYNYGKLRISTHKEKILVAQRLYIEDFFEIPTGYPFVIFEYDFETEELKFLSTVYSSDWESYTFHYNISCEVEEE